MKALLRSVPAILLMTLFLAAGARAAGESPEVIVKSAIDDVLEASKTTRDRSALRKLAEQKVIPYFDFTDMTRLAVGANWRKATPEQQRALENAFRTLLVNTYTNAIAQSGNTSRSVDVKAGPSKDDDAMVRTVIREQGKQPIAVDYRLSRKAGQWKAYDVVVEGVSLVTNYRTSFQEEVSRGGIDGLIKTLEERNRTLAKG
jgi:phospholipid transport system substrate-binding protein